MIYIVLKIKKNLINEELFNNKETYNECINHLLDIETVSDYFVKLLYEPAKILYNKAIQ